MKIKTKKTMNLSQLIEWGFENDVTGSIYSNDRVEAKKIRFEIGVIASMYGDMHKNDTFTVETKQEITKDTEFTYLIEITKSGEIYRYRESSMHTPLDHTTKEFHAYIDGEFKLIWRDGKMVE